MFINNIVDCSKLEIIKDWYQDGNKLFRELAYQNKNLNIQYSFKGNQVKINYKLNGVKAYRVIINKHSYFATVKDIFEAIMLGKSKYFIDDDKKEWLINSYEEYKKHNIIANLSEINNYMWLFRNYIYKIAVPSNVSKSLKGVYEYKTFTDMQENDWKASIIIEQAYGDNIWYQSSCLKYQQNIEFRKGNNFYNIVKGRITWENKKQKK